MTKLETLDVGVVVERRRIDHPWQEWEWRPVGVFVGARADSDWEIVDEGDGWTRYHAATLPIELHRRETETYVLNLETEQPSVYIVMRDDDEDESEHPYYISLVTANPYEAQDYLDSGEEIVERVHMPDPVLAWLRNFVQQHHVEEKFIKRQRDKVKPEEYKFGNEPLVELRKRIEQSGPQEDDD